MILDLRKAVASVRCVRNRFQQLPCRVIQLKLEGSCCQLPVLQLLCSAEGNISFNVVGVDEIVALRFRAPPGQNPAFPVILKRHSNFIPCLVVLHGRICSRTLPHNILFRRDRVSSVLVLFQILLPGIVDRCKGISSIRLVLYGLQQRFVLSVHLIQVKGEHVLFQIQISQRLGSLEVNGSLCLIGIVEQNLILFFAVQQDGLFRGHSGIRPGHLNLNLIAPCVGRVPIPVRHSFRHRIVIGLPGVFQRVVQLRESNAPAIVLNAQLRLGIIGIGFFRAVPFPGGRSRRRCQGEGEDFVSQRRQEVHGLFCRQFQRGVMGVGDLRRPGAVLSVPFGISVGRRITIHGILRHGIFDLCPDPFVVLLVSGQLCKYPSPSGVRPGYGGINLFPVGQQMHGDACRDGELTGPDLPGLSSLQLDQLKVVGIFQRIPPGGYGSAAGAAFMGSGGIPVCCLVSHAPGFRHAVCRAHRQRPDYGFLSVLQRKGQLACSAEFRSGFLHRFAALCNDQVYPAVRHFIHLQGEGEGMGIPAVVCYSLLHRQLRRIPAVHNGKRSRFFVILRRSVHAGVMIQGESFRQRIYDFSVLSGGLQRDVAQLPQVAEKRVVLGFLGHRKGFPASFLRFQVDRGIPAPLGHGHGPLVHLQISDLSRQGQRHRGAFRNPLRNINPLLGQAGFHIVQRSVPVRTVVLAAHGLDRLLVRQRHSPVQPRVCQCCCRAGLVTSAPGLDGFVAVCRGIRGALTDRQILISEGVGSVGSVGAAILSEHIFVARIRKHNQVVAFGQVMEAVESGFIRQDGFHRVADDIRGRLEAAVLQHLIQSCRHVLHGMVPGFRVQRSVQAVLILIQPDPAADGPVNRGNFHLAGVHRCRSLVLVEEGVAVNLVSGLHCPLLIPDQLILPFRSRLAVHRRQRDIQLGSRAHIVPHSLQRRKIPAEGQAAAVPGQLHSVCAEGGIGDGFVVGIRIPRQNRRGGFVAQRVLHGSGIRGHLHLFRVDAQPSAVQETVVIQCVRKAQPDLLDPVSAGEAGASSVPIVGQDIPEPEIAEIRGQIVDPENVYQILSNFKQGFTYGFGDGAGSGLDNLDGLLSNIRFRCDLILGGILGADSRDRIQGLAALQVVHQIRVADRRTVFKLGQLFADIVYIRRQGQGGGSVRIDGGLEFPVQLALRIIAVEVVIADRSRVIVQAGRQGHRDLDGCLLCAVGHQLMVLHGAGDGKLRAHLEVGGAFPVRQVIGALGCVAADILIRVVDLDAGKQCVQKHVVAPVPSVVRILPFVSADILRLLVTIIVFCIGDMGPLRPVVGRRDFLGRRKIGGLPVVFASVRQRAVNRHAIALRRVLAEAVGVQHGSPVAVVAVGPEVYLVGPAIGGPASGVIGRRVGMADIGEIVGHLHLRADAEGSGITDADIPEFIQESNADAFLALRRKIGFKVGKGGEIQQILLTVSVHIRRSAVVVHGVVAGGCPHISGGRVCGLHIRNQRGPLDPVGSVRFGCIENRQVAAQGLCGAPGCFRLAAPDHKAAAADAGAASADPVSRFVHRAAADGRKHIRVKLLQQVQGRHVIPFHQVVCLGVEIFRSNIIAREPGLIIRGQLRAVPEHPAFNEHRRSERRGALSVIIADDRPCGSSEIIVFDQVVRRIVSARCQIQADAGGYIVVAVSHFTGGMCFHHIRSAAVQPEVRQGFPALCVRCVVDGRLSRDASAFVVRHRRVHIQMHIGFLRHVLHLVRVEGEEDLNVSGREGFDIGGVEKGAGFSVGSSVGLVVVVELVIADLYVIDRLLRVASVSVVYILAAAHLPAAAAVTAVISPAGVERRRVPGIAGYGIQIVLVVPVHVPGIQRAVQASSVAALCVFLVSPEEASPDAQSFIFLEQFSAEAHVKFQRGIRQFNALESLGCIVVQADGYSIAQDGSVGSFRIVLGFLSAHLRSGSDIEVTGMNQVRVPLDGGIIFRRRGNRDDLRLGLRVCKMLILPVGIAVHPGTENRLDGIPVPGRVDADGEFPGQGDRVLDFRFVLRGRSQIHRHGAGDQPSGNPPGSASGGAAALAQLFIPVGPHDLHLFALAVDAGQQHIAAGSAGIVDRHLIGFIGHLHLNPVPNGPAGGGNHLVRRHRQRHRIGDGIKGSDHLILLCGIIPRGPADDLSLLIQARGIFRSGVLNIAEQCGRLVSHRLRGIAAVCIGPVRPAEARCPRVEHLQGCLFFRRPGVEGRLPVRFNGCLNACHMHVRFEGVFRVMIIIIRGQLQILAFLQISGQELAVSDVGGQNLSVLIRHHQQVFSVFSSGIPVVLPDIVARIPHLIRQDQRGQRMAAGGFRQVGFQPRGASLKGGAEIIARGRKGALVVRQQAAGQIEGAAGIPVLGHAAADVGAVLRNLSANHVGGAAPHVKSAAPGSAVVLNRAAVRQVHPPRVHVDGAAGGGLGIGGVPGVGDLVGTDFRVAGRDRPGLHIDGAAAGGGAVVVNQHRAVRAACDVDGARHIIDGAAIGGTVVPDLSAVKLHFAAVVEDGALGGSGVVFHHAALHLEGAGSAGNNHRGTVDRAVMVQAGCPIQCKCSVLNADRAAAVGVLRAVVARDAVCDLPAAHGHLPAGLHPYAAAQDRRAAGDGANAFARPVAQGSIVHNLQLASGAGDCGGAVACQRMPVQVQNQAHVSCDGNAFRGFIYHPDFRDSCQGTVGQFFLGIIYGLLNRLKFRLADHCHNLALFPVAQRQRIRLDLQLALYLFGIDVFRQLVKPSDAFLVVLLVKHLLGPDQVDAGVSGSAPLDVDILAKAGGVVIDGAVRQHKAGGQRIAPDAAALLAGVVSGNYHAVGGEVPAVVLVGHRAAVLGLVARKGPAVQRQHRVVNQDVAVVVLLRSLDIDAAAVGRRGVSFKAAAVHGDPAAVDAIDAAAVVGLIVPEKHIAVQVDPDLIRVDGAAA